MRTGRLIGSIADVGFRMVLDGELVAVSDDGNVDFYRLGERMLQRLSTRADISETPTRQLLAADPDNHSDVARLTSAARPARPVRAS